MKGTVAKLWKLVLALAVWQGASAQNVVVDGEVGIVSGSLPDNTGAPLPPPIAASEVPPAIAQEVPGVSFAPTALLAPSDEQSPGQSPVEQPSDNAQFPPVPPPPTAQPVGHLFHLCGCNNTDFNFEPRRVQRMRNQLSNRFSSGGGTKSTVTWSDHIWTFGQLIDHDIVATVGLTDDKQFPVKMRRRNPFQQATMRLSRLQVDPEEGQPQCRAPTTIQTPLIDASMIYGLDPMYLKNTLRLPNSCKLRTSAGDFNPVTTRALNKCNRADPSQGCNQYVSGDLRVNENAALTGVHVAFLREHNRLCDDPKLDGMGEEEKFGIVRAVIIGKLHQITVNEFLPVMASIRLPELRAWKPLADKPDISVEFDIAYRMGHDTVTNVVGQFSLQELFGAEAFFGVNSDAGTGDIDEANNKLNTLMAEARTHRAGELDGKFSDSMRNILFGRFGSDLAVHNYFRAAELGMQPYSVLTQCFGTEPSPAVLQRLRQARLDNPAFGLFQETALVGSPFVGPTVKNIVMDQFHRILFGKGGFWWEDDLPAVGPFAAEIRDATLGSIFRAAFGGPAGTWDGNIMVNARQ